MRQSVSEANKYLRQTVKSVEAGGVATLAQAMEHPGTLQEVHVTTLDAADAEIPAAAGLSEGVKLPTRIETKKLVIVGKFPIATQAEYDALSDAMKDKAVLLTVDECPIGSEVKAIECNTLGIPVDANNWVMGLNGWKGGSASTLLPDGSTSFAGPLRAANLVRGKSSGVWAPGPLARFNTSTSQGFTTQTIAAAPHRFSRMRVAVGSVANGAAYNVTSLLFGVTNTADTFSPSVGGAVTDDPTTGLVSAISAPLSVASNPGGLVSRIWSDWVNMPSIEDSNGKHLWLARYETDGPGAAYLTSGVANGWRLDGYGNFWQTKRTLAGANGYCGANAAAFGPAADSSQFQTFTHIVEAQFSGCESGQISVAAFGASTIFGAPNVDLTDNRGGFLGVTNGVAVNGGLGLSIVNHAKASITTQQVFDNVIARGVNTEYDILLMPVFSSSDGFSEAVVAKQLMRAFAARDAAARYGQKMLFVILPHNGASSGDALAVRAAAESRLFAAGGVIDLCPIVQGASRYSWDAAYSSDGIHANSPGWARLAEFAPSVVLSAIRLVIP